MTIKQELQRRLEICEKATPGPYEVDDQSASVWTSDHEQLAQTAASPGCGMKIHWDFKQRIKNANFISHSRTGYPQVLKVLLVAVEALEDSAIRTCFGHGKNLSERAFTGPNGGFCPDDNCVHGHARKAIEAIKKELSSDGEEEIHSKPTGPESDPTTCKHGYLILYEPCPACEGEFV